MGIKHRRARERRERRQAILDARARDLSAKRATRPSTMDEVCRERPSSRKGTLYLYFKNKDDLFSGALGAQRRRHSRAL